MYDLCWSSDSNCIITGSVDNSAIVWDVQKGRVLCTTDLILTIRMDDFGACEHMVALGMRDCVFMLFPGQQLSILNDSKQYVQGVAWDPLGQYVITASSDR